MRTAAASSPAVQPDQQLTDRIPRRGLRQPADHVLQLAGRDLARAPAAVGVLRQSIGHGLHAACHDGAMGQGGVSGLVTGTVFKIAERQFCRWRVRFPSASAMSFRGLP